MRPNALLHNPSSAYLRGLIDTAGVSHREAARMLGLSWNGFHNYLRNESDPLYRPANYCVQFALECLACESSQ
ncbi:hypothetical protein ACDH55_24695 [Pseudomonas tremae]|uniref:hypothetical protein n=1 Tax=Pseudomonas syringae group TaxID=136849 RepID=UPI000EFF54C6|nr:hypothetical protein [Pseudomonas coronafaciens]